MVKRRTIVLDIVQANLQAQHRITHILRTLRIPRSTYYGYYHWHPSKTACRHHLIKQSWLNLASIYNPTTRRGVAYNISSEMTQELATSPIKTILKRPDHPTIIHSDI